MGRQYMMQRDETAVVDVAHALDLNGHPVRRLLVAPRQPEREALSCRVPTSEKSN